jgi:hypothetical protein
MLRLVISDSSGERSFVTERSEILLGRREDVDLVVQDPAASRSHCMLRVEGDRVKLVDLGTVNGTRFEGRKVDQASLGAGDEFAVGKTTIRVAAFGAPVVPQSPPAKPLVRSGLSLEPDSAAPAAGPRAPTPTGAGPSDFSRELRSMISRAPWYLVSLVVHVLALMVLDLVTFSKVETGIHMPLEATVPGKPPEIDEAADLPDPDLDVPEPELDEELVLPEDEPEPATANSPPPMILDPEIKLGTSGPKRPIRLRRPLLVQPKNQGVGDKVDKTNLDEEHRGAADVVRKGLSRSGRGIPTGLPADRIVVVEGEFDKMERVLDAYRIRYTLIQRKDLVRRRFPRAKMLCINCARNINSADRSKYVATVKSFVQRGGWLITSDWSIEPYLTMGFPDRVRTLEKRRHQPDTVVTVRQTSTSPILDGVFSRRARTDWWLEETSTMFDVTSDKVNVLIVSDDMQQRYGSNVVAFDFLSGQGRVLHLLGHFYQKDGNRMGIVGMHRLILNYIIERFPERASRR